MASFNDVIVTIRDIESHYALQVCASDKRGISRTYLDFGELNVNTIAGILHAELSAQTYQSDILGRLAVCASPELFALHWKELHDGQTSVALRQPFFILNDEILRAQPITIPKTPVRILVTTAKTDHQSSFDDARLIEKSLKRYSPLVELTVEKKVTKWRLFDIFRNAEKKSFHVWHHVGLVKASPAGLYLDLEDTEVQPNLVSHFISLQDELRLFVVHTLEKSSLVAAFGSLPLRAIVAFQPSHLHSSTKQLMESFYDRLLSHDLSVAVFLARLDLDTLATQVMDWNSIALFARTTELGLIETVVPSSLPTVEETRGIIQKIYHFYEGANVNTGDTINMSGNFSGTIINIKNTLTNTVQTINEIPVISAEQKQFVTQLLEQLSIVLQQAPIDQAEPAEALAKAAKELVEKAAKEHPNKTSIQPSVEKLKQAAATLVGVLPAVVPLAMQIAETVQNLIDGINPAGPESS